MNGDGSGDARVGAVTDHLNRAEPEQGMAVERSDAAGPVSAAARRLADNAESGAAIGNSLNVFVPFVLSSTFGVR